MAVSGPLKASMVIFCPDMLMYGVILPVKMDVLGEVVGVLSMVKKR